MSKSLRLILAALLLPLLSSAQYRDDAALYRSLGDSPSVRSMKETVSFLCSNYLDGRAAGSEGEKEAASYLAAQFTEAGVTLLSPDQGEIFGIRRESGDTLTSRNVVGFIPGTAASKSTT